MPDYKLATKQKRNFKLFHARGVVPVSPCLGRGSQDKFFGLGCPIYCTQPGVASLLLVLVIGGLLGFCSCLLVLWTFWTHLRSDLPAPLTWCPPSSTASPSRYSALAGYWNERGPNVCLWEESHPHCR